MYRSVQDGGDTMLCPSQDTMMGATTLIRDGDADGKTEHESITFSYFPWTGSFLYVHRPTISNAQLSC